MPVRILEYEIAIIKSAIDYKKFGQRDYKIPKVISIVLYTGKRKWNANKPDFTGNSFDRKED